MSFTLRLRYAGETISPCATQARTTRRERRERGIEWRQKNKLDEAEHRPKLWGRRWGSGEGSRANKRKGTCHSLTSREKIPRESTKKSALTSARGGPACYQRTNGRMGGCDRKTLKEIYGKKQNENGKRRCPEKASVARRLRRDCQCCNRCFICPLRAGMRGYHDRLRQRPPFLLMDLRISETLVNLHQSTRRTTQKTVIFVLMIFMLFYCT
jgi:hypothetical protein